MVLGGVWWKILILAVSGMGISSGGLLVPSICDRAVSSLGWDLSKVSGVVWGVVWCIFWILVVSNVVGISSGGLLVPSICVRVVVSLCWGLSKVSGVVGGVVWCIFWMLVVSMVMFKVVAVGILSGGLLVVVGGDCCRFWNFVMGISSGGWLAPSICVKVLTALIWGLSKVSGVVVAGVCCRFRF